jgi:hypothetical protein
MQAMQRENQAFNMQLLGLQEQVQQDSQRFKLDPKAALDQVVERVLDRQLGANAPVALRTQLRDALRDTISSDPLLADRLRGLG